MSNRSLLPINERIITEGWGGTVGLFYSSPGLSARIVDHTLNGNCESWIDFWKRHVSTLGLSGLGQDRSLNINTAHNVAPIRR